ncbi:MAG: alpha amylase C-terminal domain-containing protein, partial [Lachnospiraceae bacterium]|nr:alpha amylase C-terminal domain-containing protein [Lachnospiraceae bacterium]
KDTLLVVVNFAGIEQDLVVGVPFDGKYRVIFTSEDLSFGGNEPGNADAINAVRKDVDGREFAIRVHVPALSVTIFDYTAYTVKERAIRKIKQETEYQRELELEKNAAALEEAHRAEEEKLLAELHARQKKEKEQKAKEIEEKYLKLEAEQIKEAGKDTPAKGTKKK